MTQGIFSECSHPEQERLTRLTEISIRSLSAVADLHIQSEQLHKKTEHITWFAPHLAAPWAQHTTDQLRALADATALRFMHSDFQQFERDAPLSQQELWVMHILEQYRVEAIAPPHYKGMQTNLNTLFDAWSGTVFASEHMESEVGVFFFAFLLICRARLSGIAIDERYQEAIESARMTLAPTLGTPLVKMRRALYSQADFAPPAREAAALIIEYITAQQQAAASVNAQNKAPQSTAVLFLQDYQKTNQPLAVVSYDIQASRKAATNRYDIFTKQYDREIHAHCLVRDALLTQYRCQINQAIATSGINLRVIEKWLSPLLQQQVYSGWRDDQYSGVIDGKKLAGLISSPNETRVFKRERIEPHAHCAVSMLIDTSGSMKQHREVIAMIVDVFSYALTRLEIDCEVLGFTTRTWGGGQAKKLWHKQGAAANPGRVCDTEHIVYKDFSSNWRKAKHSIAAILHQPLYKEGVDGEAVAWACERLVAHTQERQRRILLVLSDGSPMESASTYLNNDDDYLCHHLAATVRHYQQTHHINICGVGVGLSLRPFYPHHCALSLADGVTMSLIKTIAGML